MRLLCSCGGGGAKNTRGHEEGMRLAVEPHRLCSELSLDGLDSAELVRRVFMEDVDHPLTSGSKQQAGLRLVDCGIDSAGNRERLNDVSVLGIHHHQHLRLASRTKKPM